MESEIDDRFFYGLTPRTISVDMSKLEYGVPTPIEKYKQRYTGFDPYVYDVIEAYENRTSNNQFKRTCKRIHAQERMKKNMNR